MHTDTAYPDNKLNTIRQELREATEALLQAQRDVNFWRSHLVLADNELLFANLVNLSRESAMATHHISQAYEYMQMCHALVHPLPPLDVAESDDDNGAPPDEMSVSEVTKTGQEYESSIACKCQSCGKFVRVSWGRIGQGCPECDTGALKVYTPDTQESLSLGSLVTCAKCDYTTFATHAPKHGECPNCDDYMLAILDLPRNPNPPMYWQCYKCYHVVHVTDGLCRGDSCPVCEEGVFGDVIPF